MDKEVAEKFVKVLDARLEKSFKVVDNRLEDMLNQLEDLQEARQNEKPPVVNVNVPEIKLPAVEPSPVQVISRAPVDETIRVTKRDNDGNILTLRREYDRR